MQQLSAQLKSLGSLRNEVGGATGSALAKLSAEVAASVAASSAVAQQAQAAASNARAEGGAITAADYAKATAELDRRMVAVMADDQRHNDAAHQLAARNGVDLKDYDKEREALEKERQEAIAHGDKRAEREAEMQLTLNTKNALIASGASPEEIAEHQETVDAANAALAQQIALQAGLKANAKGLVRGETDEAISQSQAQSMQDAQTRTAQLGNVGAATEATRAHVESSVHHVVDDAQRDTAPSVKIEAALTPAAREAAKLVGVSLGANYDAAKSASNFELGGMTVALSTAPDAHTTVEVPRAGAKITGQALGGLA